MIRRLDDDVSKRIKAQQCIQSTYMVVKELIENSIDSGSRSIRVRIDESIGVEDDGEGIDDLSQVGIEGSTSKEFMSYYVLGYVDHNERFYHGFRGQALSSISNLCDLEIVSRSKESFAFRRDFNEDTITRCARERGTTVHVKNLFKNCPVRRSVNDNNIKADLRKICDLIESYRCINKIHFTLFYKRKVFLSCTGYENAREYFNDQYPDFIGTCLDVSNEMFDLLILPVSISNHKQMIFLDKRPISNKKITNTIKSGFNLYVDGMATFVLILNGVGDVNVSVDKSEVIFPDESTILNCIRSEIDRFFSSSVLIEPRSSNHSSYHSSYHSSDRDYVEPENPFRVSRPTQENKMNYETRSYDMKNDTQNQVMIHDTPPFDHVLNSSPSETSDIRSTIGDVESTIPSDIGIHVDDTSIHGSDSLLRGAYSFFEYDEIVQPELSFSKDDFNRLEIIGQFNNGFIITRLDKDNKIYLIAIDQHAADEIKNFETIRKTFHLKKQKVIVPINLNLSSIEEMIVSDHLELLDRNGFVVRNGMLETVPIHGNEVLGINDFNEFLDDIKNEEYEFKRLRSIIASKACRSSVMIGDVLSTSDMRRIVRNLALLDKPWKCPHGRPTFMVLNDLPDK